MAPTEQQQREEAQKAALNAGRYRKQTLQQQFRGDLLQENQNVEQEEDGPEESQHKSRLALLKAGAIKRANSAAGQAVGSTVGGAVGSIVPVIGTGIGAFVGRFIGKKTGITGIIIFVIFALILLLMMFIAIIKGACENVGPLGRGLEYLTTNICPSLK
jgi:hypothetical protein